MFRSAAPNAFDTAISKATDENLTSEDWGAILEVCDLVSSDTKGPTEAVQSLIKRLAHRNANVQLYTLEVANALSLNCGKEMHRELASRAFTEALLKLTNDRNTHTQVKSKIIERMKDWSDAFKSDTDLGLMYDAYYRLQQSNPTLQPPSAPQKDRLTDLDRQKEEEELQMALKLSLQDEESKRKAAEAAAASARRASGSDATGQAAATTAVPLRPTSSGTTAATVSRVRALYDFVPTEPGELEFKKGDVVAVLESVYRDWWRGSLKGQTGIFPLNYVEKLTDPTPEELHREALMENEVFAEIKNVEKLLTLLSTTNPPRDEDGEEISKLYHQTLAIRPKLIKLIEKYSQKKDDFTQLNEKFIKARRDYEALLDSSMSHPPRPNYQQYAVRPSPHMQPAGTYAGHPPAPAATYPPRGPQQIQDPQRYYSPAPQSPSQTQPQHPHQISRPQIPSQQQQQYPHPHQPHQPPPQPQQSQQPHHQSKPPFPASSPSPNALHQQRTTASPAPFYVAGTEVLAQTTPTPVPQEQGQSHRPPPPSQHSYNAHPSAMGKQPVPFQPQPPQPQPSQPSLPTGQYATYSRPPFEQPRLSIYGAPQELSTSVYDSPIVPRNTPPSGGIDYMSSPYAIKGGSSTNPPTTTTNYNNNPSAPAPVDHAVAATGPGAPTTAPPAVPPTAATASINVAALDQALPQQPMYQPYTAYDASAPQPQQPSQPSQPTPVIPQGLTQQLLPPSSIIDARNTLPSRAGVTSPTPSAPPQVTGAAPEPQLQYMAYVPPSVAAEGVDASEYYRTAAY